MKVGTSENKTQTQRCSRWRNLKKKKGSDDSFLSEVGGGTIRRVTKLYGKAV